MEDIRNYINILEYYTSRSPILIEEDIEQIIPEPINISEKLQDIVFKLRAYIEPSGGEYSLGFEQGLEMASRMIENVINLMDGEKSGS